MVGIILERGQGVLQRLAGQVGLAQHLARAHQPHPAVRVLRVGGEVANLLVHHAVDHRLLVAGRHRRRGLHVLRRQPGRRGGRLEPEIDPGALVGRVQLKRGLERLPGIGRELAAGGLVERLAVSRLQRGGLRAQLHRLRVGVDGGGILLRLEVGPSERAPALDVVRLSLQPRLQLGDLGVHIRQSLHGRRPGRGRRCGRRRHLRIGWPRPAGSGARYVRLAHLRVERHRADDDRADHDRRGQPVGPHRRLRHRLPRRLGRGQQAALRLEPGRVCRGGVDLADCLVDVHLCEFRLEDLGGVGRERRFGARPQERQGDKDRRGGAEDHEHEPERHEDFLVGSFPRSAFSFARSSRVSGAGALGALRWR